MSKIFNWGYIGLGWIAEHTVSAFAQTGQARVYAAASHTPGNAREFARRHGIPKAYTSYEEDVYKRQEYFSRAHEGADDRTGTGRTLLPGGQRMQLPG